MSTTRTPHNPWTRQLDDIVRAASGGFLFSIPLLYTMEIWWVGTYVDPERMAIALALTYGVVFLLNRTSGFRRAQDASGLDLIISTTEALATALIFTAAVLILLRRVTLATPPLEGLGKVIYEAVPFALGAALARQFLSSERSQLQGDERKQYGDKAGLNATLTDIGATIVGGIFIGLTIAPTTEVPMLAADMSAPWLLALMAASLLISYGIVFESGFADQQRRQAQRGIFQRPLSETVVSYLVSLAVSAGMLWFFKQFGMEDPWQMWLSYTIVLGFPASVGGAAGRIAV